MPPITNCVVDRLTQTVPRCSSMQCVTLNFIYFVGYMNSQHTTSSCIRHTHQQPATMLNLTETTQVIRWLPSFAAVFCKFIFE